SQLGRGSTFHFTACFHCPQPAEEHDPPVDVPEEFKGLPVLVAEPNPTGRRLLGKQLRALGLEPTETATADVALEASEAARHTGRPFGLALVSARMPAGEGFTLAARLRKERPAVPVVFLLSTQDRQADLARCREAGA